MIGIVPCSLRIWALTGIAMVLFMVSLWLPCSAAAIPNAAGEAVKVSIGKFGTDPGRDSPSSVTSCGLLASAASEHSPKPGILPIEVVGSKAPAKSPQSSDLTQTPTETTVRPRSDGNDSLRESLKILSGQVANSVSQIQSAILLLTGAILVATLILGIVQVLGAVQGYRVTSALSDRLKKELDQVETKAELAIDRKMHQSVKEISEWANSKIMEHLDENFLKALEDRTLSAAYVRNAIWDLISERMIQAGTNNEPNEVLGLWSRFFQAELALKQVLSSDFRTVFNGLGTLRSLTRQGTAPKDLLWRLVCVLEKQGRFNNLDTRELAEQLGDDIGRSFDECPDFLSDGTSTRLEGSEG